MKHLFHSDENIKFIPIKEYRRKQQVETATLTHMLKSLGTVIEPTSRELMNKPN